MIHDRDDKEYSELTAPEVLTIVQKILAKNFGGGSEDYRASEAFRGHGDSLDEVEALMELEDEFDVEIDDDKWAELRTPSQIAAFVYAELHPEFKANATAFDTLKEALNSPAAQALSIIASISVMLS